MRNLILALFMMFSGALFAQEPEVTDDPYSVITPVQTQLDGYNTGDLELFLSAYHDSVMIYNFPAELSYKGKAQMRETYGGMFERLPDLQCRLVNRIVMGNRVFDHESVTFEKGKPPIEVVAMYRIEEGKIIEVRFIRKN